MLPGILLLRYILYKYVLISCLTLEVHKGRGREIMGKAKGNYCGFKSFLVGLEIWLTNKYINGKMKIRTTVYIFQDYVLFSRLYSVVIVNFQQQIKTDFYM